jgi:hypothetical protein
MRKGTRKQKSEDINQIAARMVRETEQAAELADLSLEQIKEASRAYSAALGRIGGLKGGRARAKSMSKEERSASASKAARARWANRNGQA